MRRLAARVRERGSQRDRERGGGGEPATEFDVELIELRRIYGPEARKRERGEWERGISPVTRLVLRVETFRACRLR